jgi:uncharacterized tellurite resistance protein B-like protein
MLIHETFADFVLFLYIHMAHADNEPHQTEKKIILEKIQKLFQNIDVEKKYYDACREYKKVPATEINSIISDSFRHFKDVKFSTKYKVYTDMYDIIHADGRIDSTETTALNQLKEIIEMGSDRGTNS